MKTKWSHIFTKAFQLMFAATGGLLAALVILILAHKAAVNVAAAPIPPPEGYPKLSLSTKIVSPTLAHTGGVSLTYWIEIRNTGAYAAFNASLTDTLPSNTTYNHDATATSPQQPSFQNGVLSWVGDVGFDSSVIIQYSVNVIGTFSGIISNTAVISHPLIAAPVHVSAEAMITDDPVFTIQKSATPDKPGPNKQLVYNLEVVNTGQPAANLPITVTDEVPTNTTLLAVGTYGSPDPSNTLVTWTRPVTLAFGESTAFTFSVTTENAPSGTVISNENYQVDSPVSSPVSGEAYTVTVIDPIFLISKSISPYPPGSNREMTYTISILNKGSLATDLLVTDLVPQGTSYVRGGSLDGDTVSWVLPSLDTNETVQVSFTVYVGDVAEVDVVNPAYGVCSGENVCLVGEPVTNVIQGPTFEALAFVDPIAKKPGGGGNTTTVTPTLVIRNLGPGNALDATALILFRRISVGFANDLIATPPIGSLSVGPDCGDKCNAYLWNGDLGFGEAVTITTNEGQSTIGGEEGTHYTATVVITDVLGDFTTAPITATAIGTVTHFANLIPVKTAPAVIGAGQLMTYTINVHNSGLSTDTPPFPTLSETVPASVTLVNVSDGGAASELDGKTVISWTLPSLGPGDQVGRSFSVLVDPDLVSGTLLVNDAYQTSWFDIEATGTLSNIGTPITTVVKEIGLIDSFKTVSPQTLRPGPDNVLTFTIHVVNSSPAPLNDVQVNDLLPWQDSTYQRDAVASSGSLISDIVSFVWNGDLAPYSTELITLTVLVDDGFEGTITNTAWINHESLDEPVEVQAVAYITNKPVLKITKRASPDPVKLGNNLIYTIRVTNLGQQATSLVITDVIPAGTQYVLGTSSAGGKLEGNQLQWKYPYLNPGESVTFAYQVKVLQGKEVINKLYAVYCDEGVRAVGLPVVTRVIQTGPPRVLLPVMLH